MDPNLPTPATPPKKKNYFMISAILIALVSLLIGGVGGYILGVSGNKDTSYNNTIYPTQPPMNSQFKRETAPPIQETITPTPVVNTTTGYINIENKPCDISFVLPPKINPTEETSGYWEYSAGPAPSPNTRFTYNPIIQYVDTTNGDSRKSYIGISCSDINNQTPGYDGNVLLKEQVMNSFGIKPINKITVKKWGQDVVQTNFANGAPQIEPTDTYYFFVTPKHSYEIYSRLVNVDSQATSEAKRIIDSIKFMD